MPFEKEQRELPKLADRLGFANVVISELRRKVSALDVKSGQDASYILELEVKARHLELKVAELELQLSQKCPDPLDGKKLKSLADKRLVDVCRAQLKAMRENVRKMKATRDGALSQLAGLRTKAEAPALTRAPGWL